MEKFQQINIQHKKITTKNQTTWKIGYEKRLKHEIIIENLTHNILK